MTSEKIKSGIYKWGFYPALVLLKEQQDLENYQECEIIKEALDQVGKGRDWYLSSKVDDDSMDRTYDEIIKDSTSLDANMPHYIGEFKKYVLL